VNSLEDILAELTPESLSRVNAKYHRLRLEVDMAEHAKFERDALLRDLREGVIEVLFTKVDDTDRVMKCTLMPQLLPETYKVKADESFHERNPNVLAVWDVENNGWRSFRIEQVRYVQALDHVAFV
jgi:hypothetical protein